MRLSWRQRNFLCFGVWIELNEVFGSGFEAQLHSKQMHGAAGATLLNTTTNIVERVQLYT